MPRPLLSWKAHEFEQQKKGPMWFVVFAVIVIGLIFLAFWWKAFTMMVFLILAVFLIIIYALKEPRIVNFSITPLGMDIDNVMYKYSDMSSFWIFYEPPEIKELNIKLTRGFFPHLSIPLGKTDPNDIRRILLEYLPEKKEKPSVADGIARRLKF
jgi:hypothetical protein